MHQVTHYHNNQSNNNNNPWETLSIIASVLTVFQSGATRGQTCKYPPQPVAPEASINVRRDRSRSQNRPDPPVLKRHGSDPVCIWSKRLGCVYDRRCVHGAYDDAQLRNPTEETSRSLSELSLGLTSGAPETRCPPSWLHQPAGRVCLLSAGGGGGLSWVCLFEVRPDLNGSDHTKADSSNRILK